LPGIELFAQATADDMYTSIKKLTEKLKKQLLKSNYLYESAYQFDDLLLI
jgi:ribosome-associated translation inhibitor RaiA